MACTRPTLMVWSLIFAVPLLLGPAPATTQKEHKDKTTWSPNTDGYRIGLAYADKRNSGDRIDFDLYIQNLDGSPLTLTDHLDRPLSFVQFAVSEGAEGKVSESALRTRRLPSSESITHSIEKGQQFHIHDSLNRYFDLTVPQSYMFNVTVQAIGGHSPIELTLRSLPLEIRYPEQAGQLVKEDLNGNAIEKG